MRRDGFDITDLAGAYRGVAFVHGFEASAPGPTVVVNALTHGNERCGIAAARWAMAASSRLACGRLIVVLANHRAYRAHDPVDPRSGRIVDRDFNRIWDELDRPSTAWEIERARELAPIYAQADFLIDVHSTATPSPPFILHHDTAGTRALLARLPMFQHRIGFAAMLHDGRLLIEQAPFLGDDNPRAAMVVECGQSGTPGADHEAAASVAWFLHAAGVIAAPDIAFSDPCAGAYGRWSAVEMIRASSAAFRFTQAFDGFESLRRDELYAFDGDHELRAPFEGCTLLLPRRAPKAGAEAVMLGKRI